jgi:hypothetical protein
MADENNFSEMEETIRNAFPECPFEYGNENLVAFLDILGFKDFIMNKGKIPYDNPLKVYLLLHLLKELSQQRSGRANLDIVQFSDSIFVSTKWNEYKPEDASKRIEDIEQFFKIINAFYKGVLITFKNHGLLLRGAVCYGKSLTVKLKLNQPSVGVESQSGNELIMFGPGIVKAYLMEGEAKFPRIVISKEAREVVKKYTPHFSSEVITDLTDETSEDYSKYFDDINNFMDMSMMNEKKSPIDGHFGELNCRVDEKNTSDWTNDILPALKESISEYETKAGNALCDSDEDKVGTYSKILKKQKWLYKHASRYFGNGDF